MPGCMVTLLALSLKGSILTIHMSRPIKPSKNGNNTLAPTEGTDAMASSSIKVTSSGAIVKHPTKSRKSDRNLSLESSK